jgi:hypothetical protein
MFYTFSQNNSGGSFIGPAKYVVVEASSVDEACDIAENHGVYFEGCRTNLDCPCCGDRWSRVWHTDGSEKPQIYGEPAESYQDEFDLDPKIPTVLIVRKLQNVQPVVKLIS